MAQKNRIPSHWKKIFIVFKEFNTKTTVFLSATIKPARKKEKTVIQYKFEHIQNRIIEVNFPKNSLFIVYDGRKIYKIIITRRMHCTLCHMSKNKTELDG